MSFIWIFISIFFMINMQSFRFLARIASGNSCPPLKVSVIAFIIFVIFFQLTVLGLFLFCSRGKVKLLESMEPLALDSFYNFIENVSILISKNVKYLHYSFKIHA